MSKAGDRTIRSEIHPLINSVWNKEKLPKGWKESIIVPIYMRVIKQNVIIIEAGRNHNKNIENIFFEVVEQFTCLGAILTYQNSIHQKTKSRLK